MLGGFYRHNIAQKTKAPRCIMCTIKTNCYCENTPNRCSTWYRKQYIVQFCSMAGMSNDGGINTILVEVFRQLASPRLYKHDKAWERATVLMVIEQRGKEYQCGSCKGAAKCLN